MDMTGISKCNVSACAYNMGNLCRTPGITVGPHAECNTFNHGSNKAGFMEVKGGIGACIASECKFNDRLECKAPDINVSFHASHADCSTFQPRK